MPAAPRGPEAPWSVAKGVDTGLEDGQEAHQAVGRRGGTGRTRAQSMTCPEVS